LGRIAIGMGHCVLRVVRSNSLTRGRCEEPDVQGHAVPYNVWGSSGGTDHYEDALVVLVAHRPPKIPVLKSAFLALICSVMGDTGYMLSIFKASLWHMGFIPTEF
jgi:hypothetical protein